MANETILIIDADTKSQKVLEVSFKKAGYRVVMTDTPSAAAGLIDEVAPDIIIADTQFGEGSGTGFELIADIKASDAKNIPFLFLTEERALPQKMKGFELGADDYLTKPIYIKEVTTRVQLLLQKRAKELLTEDDVEEIEGNLSDITMIDLLQTIEEELRSGTIHLSRDHQSAVIYFREGNVLDAICGKLQGEEAIYRLMLWPDGEFVLRYHEQVRRIDRVEKDSGALLLEGIRRLEKHNELLDALPPLSQVFEADLDAAGVSQLPDEVARILRLFDGVRSTRDVVDGSPVDDITTLRIVQKLVDDRILVDASPGSQIDEQRSRSNLAAWLEGRATETAPSATREREDTAPKFGTSIAEMVAEKRSTTLRDITATSRSPRDTDPFGSRLQAEDVPNRTTIQLEDVFDDADPWDESESDPRRRTALQWERPRSDWNVRYSSPDEAIREIEEEEQRRREAEAQHLTGEHPPITRAQAEAARGDNVEDLDAVRRAEEERRLRDELDPPRRLTDELPSQSRSILPDELDAMLDDEPRKRPVTPRSSPAIHIDDSWGESTSAAEAVSESEVFDDSDEVARSEDSTERPTRKLRGLQPAASRDDEDEFSPGGLFDSIGDDETAPADDDDDFVPLVFESIDVAPVERQARDNELVTAAYDLSLRKTVPPAEIAGRAEHAARHNTMELPAQDYGDRFFSSDYDQDLEVEQPSNLGKWAVAIVVLLAVVAVLIVLNVQQQNKNKQLAANATPATTTTTTTATDAPTPTPSTALTEIPLPPTLRTENIEVAAASLGKQSHLDATAIAIVMSGSDLLPSDTDTPAPIEDPVEAVEAVEVPVEPPVEPPTRPTEQPAETLIEAMEKPTVKPAEKPAETPAEKPTNLRQLRRLVDSGKFNEALPVLREMSTAQPQDKDVAYLHGLAAFSADRTAEAVQHLARAERLGYRTPALYLDLAAAYQLDGKLSQAKWAYEKFLEVRPTGKQADQVRAILDSRF